MVNDLLQLHISVCSIREFVNVLQWIYNVSVGLMHEISVVM